MKKSICIIISILIVAAFAACGKSEAPEISTTSKTPEDVSVVKSEAPSTESGVEAPSTTEESDPLLCQDPEGFDYRVVKAHNAEELVQKLKSLYEQLNDDKADKFTAREREMFSSLGSILESGYIFNPSYDGKYAENEDLTATTSLKVEVVFWSDGTANAVYYCQNDSDIRTELQVFYPNAKMVEFLNKHGIEGQRMYNAGNEKPVSEYTAEEVAALGYESMKVEKITCDGQQYDAIKYTGDKLDGTDKISFICDNKIIIASFCYNDPELAATKNSEEIFETLKLEKVYFD